MNGSALTWWANRKSRMGLKPSAKAPPWDPKKPWWTTPPTSPPEPEFMEYAIQYQAECSRILVDQSRSRKERAEASAMLVQLKPWITAARRLYHERVLEFQGEDGDDLETTDGLMRAAQKSIGRLRAQVIALGGKEERRDEAVRDALMRRVTTRWDRKARDARGGR